MGGSVYRPRLEQCVADWYIQQGPVPPQPDTAAVAVAAGDADSAAGRLGGGAARTANICSMNAPLGSR